MLQIFLWISCSKICMKLILQSFYETHTPIFLWNACSKVSLCTHLLLINIFTCHMHLWLKFFCLFCIHGDEYHYLMHCNQFSRRIWLTTLRHIQCNMRYMT
jgi:hypothetical protein